MQKTGQARARITNAYPVRLYVKCFEFDTGKAPMSTIALKRRFITRIGKPQSLKVRFIRFEK